MTKKSEKVAILFPSILDVLEIPFNSQILFLEKSGIKTILINYSRKEFSYEKLKSQVLELLALKELKNKKIYFIGISFGAMNILDLVQNPDIDKRVEGIVLLGTAYSPRDVENSRQTLLHVMNLIDHISKKPVEIIFRLIKKRSLFAYDPKEHRYVNKAMVNEVFDKDKGLLQRIRYFSSKKSIESLPKVKKPALLIWWTKDASSTDRQIIISKTFLNYRSITVEGLHGWTTTPSKEINKAIIEFLK